MVSYFSGILKKKKLPELKYFICTDFNQALTSLNLHGFAVINLMDKEAYEVFCKESSIFVESVFDKHKTIDFMALGRSEYPEIRNTSKDIVKKNIESHLRTFLDSDNYEIINGTHLLKSNNKKSILNPHQDSSHVLEEFDTSYHFWIPATPPIPDFGTLEIIPYSHKLHIPYRSLNIPWVLQKYEKDLWRYMQKINVEPGQAVLFNSKLIHASSVNRSSQIRIAANSLIKKVSSDFIHCYTDKDSDYQDIEIYKITPEFYYNDNIMERPKGYPLLKTVKNTNYPYSLKELETVFLQ